LLKICVSCMTNNNTSYKAASTTYNATTWSKETKQHHTTATSFAFWLDCWRRTIMTKPAKPTKRLQDNIEKTRNLQKAVSDKGVQSAALNAILEKQQQEVKKLERYRSSIGRSKEKRKRREKHEKLLKKLNLVVESLLKRQEEKIEHKTRPWKKSLKPSFLTVVSDLRESLLELDKEDGGEKVRLPHEVSGKLTEKKKRNLIFRESEQLKEVVVHPVFQKNPFQVSFIQLVISAEILLGSFRTLVRCTSRLVNGRRFSVKSDTRAGKCISRCEMIFIQLLTEHKKAYRECFL